MEKNNKLLKIITTHKKYSSLLRKYSEFIIPIDLIKNKIKLIKGKTKKGHSRKP